MAGIDELSRVIGSLESSIETLFRKNTILCEEIKLLRKAMQNRKFWDSVKILSGAFIGGFSAMAAKMAIWR